MPRLLPFINVTVGGQAVAAGFCTRLISATIHDSPGQDSDTCEITLDDQDNEIVIPPKGSIISVQFGFQDDASWKMGTFEVEEPEIQGGEDGEKVVLTGRSAAQGKDIKEPGSEHFDNKTIGDIVQELAKRHGYQAKVAGKAAQRKLEYMARMDQSPMDFLTRLADRHGGMFSVKDGKFIFIDRGQLPAVTIDKSMCSTWSFKVAPRPRHGKVETRWFERLTGKTHYETQSTGMQGPVRRLRTMHASKDEAKSAGSAEGDRLGRNTGSGSVTVEGMPEVMADAQVMATGFRPEANGLWRCASADHEFSDAGYTTTIELEGTEKGKDGSA